MEWSFKNHYGFSQRRDKEKARADGQRLENHNNNGE
jgi:hypothetical protein